MVVIHRLGGEFVYAVVLVVHALGIVYLAAVPPEHGFGIVVGADLNCPREQRALILVLCVVAVVNARLRVSKKLLHAL